MSHAELVPNSFGGTSVAPATIASCTDGTSNTILFGEHAHNLNGRRTPTTTSTLGVVVLRRLWDTIGTTFLPPTFSQGEPRITTRRQAAENRGSAARHQRRESDDMLVNFGSNHPGGPTSPSSMARATSSRAPSTRGLSTRPPTPSWWLRANYSGSCGSGCLATGNGNFNPANTNGVQRGVFPGAGNAQRRRGRQLGRVLKRRCAATDAC